MRSPCWRRDRHATVEEPDRLKDPLGSNLLEGGMIGLVSTVPSASADGPHPVGDHLLQDGTGAAERDLRLVLDSVPAMVKTMTPSGAIERAAATRDR